MTEGEQPAQTLANQAAHANSAGSQDRADTPVSGKPAGRGWSFQDVRDAYAACVRCGYFLSGYRLAAGQPQLEAAITKVRGAWLELPWTPALRGLVEKSFGLRLDSDVYHMKGRCRECGRVFVLKLDEMEGAVPIGPSPESATTAPETDVPSEPEALPPRPDAATSASALPTAPAVEIPSAALFRIQIRPRPR